MRNGNQRMLLWCLHGVDGEPAGCTYHMGPEDRGAANRFGIADFCDQPIQLQIDGSSFGSLRPTVVLGGTPLFLLSFTDTMVFASVPVAVPPGSSALVLTSGDPKSGSSAPFEMAIGAVGPAGALVPRDRKAPQGSRARATSIQEISSSRPSRAFPVRSPCRGARHQACLFPSDLIWSRLL
jgi:hypothetical protein